MLRICTCENVTELYQKQRTTKHALQHFQLDVHISEFQDKLICKLS